MEGSTFVVVILLLLLLGIAVAGLLGLAGRIRQIDRSIKETETRLSSGVEAVRAQLTTVSTSSQETMLRVTQDLGALGESTKLLREETGKLSALREALRAPGPRGGFGERLLENVLRDVFAADQYETQHGFKDGKRVDAVVRFADRLVPIDSKFPTESFDALLSAESDDDRATARRAFLRACRKHVDAVAEYIRPGEGTVDYALMYVPAENVFAQMVVRERGEDDAVAVTPYAHSKNVIPVSPNSLYLYLETIAMALRGFAIERHAREIADSVAGLAREFAGIVEQNVLVGRHMGHARTAQETLNRDLDRFNEKLAAAAGGDSRGEPAGREG